MLDLAMAHDEIETIHPMQRPRRATADAQAAAEQVSPRGGSLTACERPGGIM